MSQRKKTAPSTLKPSRSSPVGRKGLIATENTKKQSAKKRTVLDNRFHRTFQAERLRPATARTNSLAETGPKSAPATKLGCRLSLFLALRFSEAEA